MAPSRTSTIKSKHAPNKSGIRNSKTSSRGSTSDGISKPKKASSASKSRAPPPRTQKSASATAAAAAAKNRRRRVYTEKELGVPTLNMVTPVGVTKAKSGKRAGKVFVDDRESMLTILAVVNAEREGQIESKMMRARKMEEVREARKEESERREGERRGKLEGVKEGLRRRRKRKGGEKGEGEGFEEEEKGVGREVGTGSGKKRKSVSFA